MRCSPQSDLGTWARTGAALRLLIADRNPADTARLVEALERADFRIDWERVDTEEDFRRALAGTPDLVLSEWQLSDFDALQALRVIEDTHPDIPFILVSESVGEDEAYELTRHGMDDFLQKDRLTRLGLAVARAIRDRDERRHLRRLEAEQARVAHDLGERVKELRALHEAARLLAADGDDEDRFQAITRQLPPAVLFPELAAARLTLGDRSWQSYGFHDTEWKLSRSFALPGEQTGCIEIAYRRRPVPDGRDPFIDEERALLDTLAEMIQEWVERDHARHEMARAALMLSNVRDAIIVTDARRLVTYWNDQATRLFGWTAEEMLGRPLETRYSEPEMQRETVDSVRELLAGGEWFGEFEDRRKDGSKVWVEARETPIINRRGEITGSISVARDITARKQNLQALKEAQARLESLVSELEAERFRLEQAQEVASIGYWVTSFDRNEVTWSDETYRVFERDPDAFTPTLPAIMEMVHPDDRAGLEQSVEAALADGESHRYEHRIVLGKERIKTVEASMRAVYDTGGRPLQIIGTCRDITAAKEAERLLRSTNEELEARVAARTRELAERENLISTTLDALSAHIALLDVDGRIVATNRAWKSFAENNGADWRQVSEGMNYLDACRRAAQDGCPEAVEASETLQRILGGELSQWSFEYACSSPDEERWFLLRARPVRIRGEVHALIAHEDISQIKQTQNELLRAARLAEQANQAKSGFLMTMSHELRTPLNGILGMNELLQTTDLDPRQQEYVQASTASGQHLLQLIDDVLDLSRIEAGKLELLPVRCDLSELVGELVATFMPLARERSLQLDYRIADDVPRLIRFDRYRLQQVLINLVGNALKFTSSGGVRLSIDTAGGPRRNGWLRFEVTDTGIGIPADRLDRLFKTFSQVDDSSSRRYGGSGLGLSICRELIDLMEGEIGVESRVDAGSTFWFEIPIAPWGAALDTEAEGADGDAPPSAARLAALEAGPALGHVLVAEDNHINQVYVCEALRRLGYRADVAANGHEVLQALERNRYDLVLMDCLMPDLDGLEATRIWRRREARAAGGERQPIVALTASASDEDRGNCMAAGMDDYISKPVTLARLDAILKRFVQGQDPDA